MGPAPGAGRRSGGTWLSAGILAAGQGVLGVVLLLLEKACELARSVRSDTSAPDILSHELECGIVSTGRVRRRDPAHDGVQDAGRPRSPHPDEAQEPKLRNRRRRFGG